MPVPAERSLTAQDLCALQFVGDPQVAPDGTHAAFVVPTTDADADEYRSRIWLVATDGAGQARPLTSGEKADTAPRWSPDGRQLAFLSTRGGKPQLYIIDLAGGEAQQPTSGDWDDDQPAWSSTAHNSPSSPIAIPMPTAHCARTSGPRGGGRGRAAQTDRQ